MRHYVIALGLLCCTQISYAEPDPFVSMGLFFAPVSEVESDPGNSIDGSGFGARVEVGGALHIHGEYLQSSLDDPAGDVDFSDTRLGMTYRSHMQNGYILASAEYVSLDFDTDDDQGIGVHLGAGFNATDSVALYGRAGMISLDDLDGPELRIGIDGKLQEGTSVYGEYRTAMLSADGRDVDVNDLRIGVRFSF